MPTPNCPDRRLLADFTAGKLDEPSSEQITVHLEQCADCQSTIVNLAEDQDTIGAALRKVSQSPVQPAGAAVRKALNSAAQMIPPPPSAKVGTSVAASGVPTVTLSLEQFAQSLSETGVVDSDELTAARSRLTAEQSEDPQALARELISAGRLTKFQALNALQGKAKGLVFGEHVVLDRIGAGGMGQVFKAKHRRMDRIVALKVLSPSAVKNADSVKRFEREVRAAAKLMHPNIVTAFDAGQQDGTHFLVMEYVDGPDLSSLLKKQGKLPIKQACDYISQAARGFAFAHSKGIVHRDIKPGNLLVDKDGTVKVLDMGLARFDDGGVGGVMTEGELTQSGAVMGTVDYMAPEQAMNTRNADAKSDVYGLGCSLYRLLTGESVYGGQTMVEKIMAHREKPIPVLRQVRPDAPPALEALVARMLAKEPSQRPSMQEVAEKLTNLDALPAIAPAAPVAPAIAAATAIGRPAQATAPVLGTKPKTQGVAPPRKRSNTPLLAAAGAGAVLIALGVWFIFRDKDGNETARVQMPDGGTVETKVDLGPEKLRPPAPMPSATPTPSVPTAVSPQPTGPDPNKFFALPQSTGTAPPPPPAPTSAAVASLPITPVTPSPSAPAAPVDLLALVELPRDVIAGRWVPDGTSIRGFPDSAVQSRLRIPFVPPSAEYDIVFNGRRTTKGRAFSGFVFGLTAGGKPCHFRVGPTQVGFSDADDDKEPNFAGGLNLPLDGHFKVVCAVRRDSVRFDFNGQTVLTYRGDFSDVPVFADAPPLFMGIIDAHLLITSYKYVPVGASSTPVAISAPPPLAPVNRPPLPPAIGAGLPPAQQLALIKEKLQQVNNGKTLIIRSQLIEAGQIVELDLNGNDLTSLEPLTGLPLKKLNLYNFRNLSGDLTALRGMPLEDLSIKQCSKLQSLHGLEGAPLRKLDCYDCRNLAGDLTVLRGMPLEVLVLKQCSSLERLHGLEGMRLTELNCYDCQGLTGDLTALRGMPLTSLDLKQCAKLQSLDGIQGMPLVELNVLNGPKLTDANRQIIAGLTALEKITTGDQQRDAELLAAVAATRKMGLVAPAVTPPSVPPTQPAAAVDLLALVQLPRDIIAGNWSRDGAKLIGTARSSRLQIPFVPAAEYDVIINAKVDRPQDDVVMHMGLIAQGRQFYGSVRRKDFVISDGDSSQPTNYAGNLSSEIGRPFTMTFAVRKDVVRYDFNGKPVFEFRGDFNQLQPPKAWSVPRPDQLFLTYNGARAFEVTSLQYLPVGGSAPIASVAPLGLPGATAADPTVVCTKLSAKTKPVGLHPSATAFAAPDGNGRRGANGFFLAAPARWQGQGTVWDFNYVWSETAHTVVMIHPTGAGHLRIHLQKDRVDVFPGGAWGGSQPWIEKSNFPIIIEPAASTIFPLPPDVPVRVSSRIGGAGAYTLSLNGKPVVSCRVSGLPPQQMKPPITDAACPTTLAVGQTALLIGPMDGGVHDATDIRLTSGDGGTVAAGAAVATTSPLGVPTPFAPLTPAAAPVAPIAPAAKQKVPEAKDQAATLALIKDVYRDDYLAARVPDKKSPFAAKLLQQATTVVDPIERYVLLNEARTLAADGDDPQVLKNVLAALVQHFEVDPAQTVVDGWKAMLAKSRPATTVRAVYDDVAQRFDAAVSAAQFDDAKKFAEFANTTAPRLTDAAISKTARERLPALTAREQEYQAAKAAVEKLATAPDDAAANAVVGRYRAVVENDWPNAFPLLAKGNEEPWKDLATKSLTAAADGPSRAAVGDAWWDAAQAKPTLKPDLTAAALYWYQASVASLTGLNKTRVEKRIADAAAIVRQQTLPPTMLGGELATLRAGDTGLKGEVPKVFEFGGAKMSPAPATSVIPGAPQNSTLADAAFQQWMKATAALPAEQQVAAVAKKLIELNPGFDGSLTPVIKNGVVTQVTFSTSRVTNISPVRALSGLKALLCDGEEGVRTLTDLSPLQGMPLTTLSCGKSLVSDLSPLRGMPLDLLIINSSKVSDLSPLRGMPLRELRCGTTPVFDLSPLHDCKNLSILAVGSTKVTRAMTDALKQALPNCKIQ